jgi:hypothetical protein
MDERDGTGTAGILSDAFQDARTGTGHKPTIDSFAYHSQWSSE